MSDDKTIEELIAEARSKTKRHFVEMRGLDLVMRKLSACQEVADHLKDKPEGSALAESVMVQRQLRLIEAAATLVEMAAEDVQTFGASPDLIDLAGKMSHALDVFQATLEQRHEGQQ